MNENGEETSYKLVDELKD